MLIKPKIIQKLEDRISFIMTNDAEIESDRRMDFVIYPLLVIFFAFMFSSGFWEARRFRNKTHKAFRAPFRTILQNKYAMIDSFMDDYCDFEITDEEEQNEIQKIFIKINPEKDEYFKTMAKLYYCGAVLHYDAVVSSEMNISEDITIIDDKKKQIKKHYNHFRWNYLHDSTSKKYLIILSQLEEDFTDALLFYLDKSGTFTLELTKYFQENRVTFEMKNHKKLKDKHVMIRYLLTTRIQEKNLFNILFAASLITNLPTTFANMHLAEEMDSILEYDEDTTFKQLFKKLAKTSEIIKQIIKITHPTNQIDTIPIDHFYYI